MHLLTAVFLLLAAPFWEAKTPQEWSNPELDVMFRDSPWAQKALLTTRLGGEAEIFVYLGSARPMQEAEAERWARRKQKPDPVAEDYIAWAAENRGKFIVLTVRVPVSASFADESETRRMAKETFLRIGRKKLAPLMHFPPSSTDPHLRYVFPREGPDSAKKLFFDFYVPSIAGAFREAEFSLKVLTYKSAVDY